MNSIKSELQRLKISPTVYQDKYDRWAKRVSQYRGEWQREPIDYLQNERKKKRGGRSLF